jgi:hypothetical protein
MRILYVKPMFGFGITTRLGTCRGGGASLAGMGEALAGTSDAVAIYIPKHAPERFGWAPWRGRVVGFVRVARMPPGKTMLDYAETAFPEDVGRWPVGWPAASWHLLPQGDEPRLDVLAKALCGEEAWRLLYPLMQGGRPVRLAGSRFAPIGDWLTALAVRAGDRLVEAPLNPRGSSARGE